MSTARSKRLIYLSFSLVLLCCGLMACGSQESSKEAAKEKAPPAAATPATPAPVATGAATPKTAEEYVNQGKEAIKSKHLDQAIASFGEAVKLDPKSIPAYNNRGIAYCEMGNFDPALADFSRVIEIDPRHGKAYNNRAVAYLMKGEKDKARQDVLKAQSLGIAVNQTLIDSLGMGAAKAEEPGIGQFPEKLPPGVSATPVRPEEVPQPGAPGKPQPKAKSEATKK